MQLLEELPLPAVAYRRDHSLNTSFHDRNFAPSHAASYIVVPRACHFPPAEPNLDFPCRTEQNTSLPLAILRALFASPGCRRRRHTTRYYAFISKYLDSTDLLLLLLLRLCVVLPCFHYTLSSLLACFFVFTTHSSGGGGGGGAALPPLRFSFCLSRSLLLLSCSLTLSFSSHSCSFCFPWLTALRFSLFFSSSCSAPAPHGTLTSHLPISSRGGGDSQILDTQYPSCSGRHFFTSRTPNRRKVSRRWLRRFALRSVLVAATKNRDRRIRSSISSMQSSDDVAARPVLYAVGSSNLFSPCQGTTSSTTTQNTRDSLIETNQLNYPAEGGGPCGSDNARDTSSPYCAVVSWTPSSVLTRPDQLLLQYAPWGYS